MVAIRLSRTGAKKKPSYRVVVIPKRRARDSRSIEIVGHYNPRQDPIEVVLKRDRITYWMSVGAQPSDRVRRLLKVFDEREAARAAEAAEQAATERSPSEQPREEPAPAVEVPLAAPGAPLEEGADTVASQYDPGDEEMDRQLEEALAAESGAQAPARTPAADAGQDTNAG